MGYRHFDTAKIYGSEAAVGEALNQTVEREDIFLTSKLWGSDHRDPVSGVTRTLNLIMLPLHSISMHKRIKKHDRSNNRILALHQKKSFIDAKSNIHAKLTSTKNESALSIIADLTNPN
ncbi:hypothetical protein HYC85_001047 [Camellia sinensis]|uniref:NADP-dependent oxidoreductase domain-containing protein n=1 Tax=Camellia sinensis TaxID=4442 RepID=A0A7J7I6R9_CAMSI|nr:hypothetical protein HYC85_001047 [Camellia sinensis]